MLVAPMKPKRRYPSRSLASLILESRPLGRKLGLTAQDHVEEVSLSAELPQDEAPVTSSSLEGAHVEDLDEPTVTDVVVSNRQPPVAPAIGLQQRRENPLGQDEKKRRLERHKESSNETSPYRTSPSVVEVSPEITGGQRSPDEACSRTTGGG